MAGGIPAGRLSIEIVAEIARLQQDLDRAKRAVNAASGDIAKSAKAANDNLSNIGKGTGAGVQQFSRDMQRLKASLDPAWAAQQKFNEQQKLGMDALRAGAINREQFIAHMRQINAEMKGVSPAMNGVTDASRSQKMGLQQLGYQLGDFSTQVSSGTSITQAFAQQIGQASQALQLMGGGTGALGRVAAFLGSGWGIALTVALPLMGMFISKLFDAKDGADKLKKSAEDAADSIDNLWKSLQQADGLSNQYTTATKKIIDAQAALGRINQQIAAIPKGQQSSGWLLIQRKRAEDAVAAAQEELATVRQIGSVQRLQEMQANKIADAEERAAKAKRDQEKAARDLLKVQADLVKFGSPVPGAPVTSGYGSRARPMAGASTNHLGVDYGGKLGTPILAAMDGIVKFAKMVNGYGNQLQLDHGGGTETRYSHLSRFNVAEGQQVRKGDVIGSMGRTGTATGVHLHYEVLVNGKKVNPSKGEFPIDPADIAAAGEKAQAAAEREAQRIQNAVEGYLDWERQLADFGAGATEAVQRINEQFNEQPKMVDRAAQATRRLDEIIKEVSERRPDNFKQIIADATAAKGVIQDALVRPFAELEQASQRRVQIQGLLAQGRTAEATALQQIWQLEAMLGPLTEARKAQVLAIALGEEHALQKINATRDALQEMRDTVGSLNLGAAFGAGGEAIDGMVRGLAQLTEAQIAYNEVRNKPGVSVEEMAKAERAFTRDKLSGTAAILGSSKKLFKEESAMYKIITAAEKVLAALQLANAIKSIAMDTTKTTSSVANAGARTAADTAAGAAKMFSFLGPFAFPVVAAMIAVMASLGFKGGGSSSAPSIPTAEELQEAAGTGSVLGDSKAKSNSIANSLEIVAANTNRDLEYSNAILKALRSIDTSISRMAGSVAQQIQVAGGMFDTSGARLGSSGSSGFLGLFASSTTRELWDLGMDLNSGSVAQILQDGIDGRTYQIVQQIKKKSGFLGIGGGTKTTYETTYGQIDESITSAIQDVIYSLRSGLIEASKVIGLDGAAAIIDNFRVEIGRLSFKDMSGEEIEQQLNAVFSKVGDDMAAAILPGLREIQQVGEGLFETFMRAARQYQVVDTALKSIGMAFGSVGVGSLAARDALVQLFGTLDEFVSQTEFYRDNFLTEAEQVAPIFSAVQAELARLGLSTVDTMAEFKGVVSGLDLTTEAGRTLYAALMALAPAFATVERFQEKEAKAREDEARAYSDHADSLRAYLKELTGGTAASFAQIVATFRSTAAAAAGGDLTALGNLRGASQDYLTAMRDRAGSLIEYQRARAQVLNSIGQGITAADSMAIAKRTMTAVETLSSEVTQLRSETNTLQMQIAENTSATARLLNRSTDVDTTRISNDADTPIIVDLVA